MYVAGTKQQKEERVRLARDQRHLTLTSTALGPSLSLWHIAELGATPVLEGTPQGDYTNGIKQYEDRRRSKD